MFFLLVYAVLFFVLREGYGGFESIVDLPPVPARIIVTVVVMFLCEANDCSVVGGNAVFGAVEVDLPDLLRGAPVERRICGI